MIRWVARTRVVLVGLLACASGSMSTVAWSADESLLNQLFAPGPLIEGHKNLERKDCLKCHEAGHGVPDQHCLACHADIKSQQNSGHGFHAHLAKSCFECHPDHRGRHFMSVQIDPAKFKHSETGFTLEGRHVSLACAKCHAKAAVRGTMAQGGRYGGLSRSCRTCHAKDDRHYFVGKLANAECSACHGMQSWNRDVRFDHAKDAGYKLDDVHARLSCAKCHAPQGSQSVQYRWPDLKNRQCAACHKDVSVLAKNPSAFDHTKTGFSLKGRHAEIGCKGCHEAERKFQNRRAPRDCVACHAKVSKHAFTGKWAQVSCGKCHGTRSWNKGVLFDHAESTGYRLAGKHAELKCVQCHKSQMPEASRYHRPDLAQQKCRACHVDPHGQKLSETTRTWSCDRCHSSTTWKIVGFDHHLTGFDLQGRHSRLDCVKCHKQAAGVNILQQGQFVWKGLQRDCASCHKNPHGGPVPGLAYGKHCFECHTANGWKMVAPLAAGSPVKFDHRTTGFELQGQHARLDCLKCHKQAGGVPGPIETRWKGLQRDCASCHNSPHGGATPGMAFGKHCAECHTPTTWKSAARGDAEGKSGAAFDHAKTRFPLAGKHASVSCNQCHIRGGKQVYKFEDTGRGVCLDCHNDHHQGRIPQACTTCHTDTTWKTQREFHKNFSLRGVHLTLSCDQCHPNGRVLAGQSDNCQGCHQKDDPHGGMTGVEGQCSRCHGQTMWEAPRFRHSQTRFPLRGAHRLLECTRCHVGGRFAGTPSDCIDCHAADAARVTFPNHRVAGFERCDKCHSQYIFSTGKK